MEEVSKFEQTFRSATALFIILAIFCQYLFYIVAVYYKDLEKLNRIRKGYIALITLIMLGYIIWAMTW